MRDEERATPEQLKAVVDDLVQTVQHTTHHSDPSRFADVALRRVRRRRMGFRAAAVGVAAAAVAMAFPVAQGILGDTSGDEDTLEEIIATGRIDFDDLELGALPEVPWYAEGAIHLGEAEVPWEGEFSDILALEEVAGGYAIVTTPMNEAEGGHDGYRLVLLHDGGETVLADGWVGAVAVSEDGSRVAWVDGSWDAAMDGDGPTAALGMADAATGEVLAELETDLGADTDAVGFLDSDRVVLDVGENKAGDVSIWDTRDDSITPIDGLEERWVDSMAPTGGIGVVTPGSLGCSVVVDLGAGGEPLWERCDDLLIRRFSADGEHLVTVSYPSESVSEEENMWRTLEVLDARTGDPVFAVEARAPFRQVWESDGDLIFEARDEDDRLALVRCSPAGQCELATEPRDSEPDPGAQPYRAPYILPAR